MELTYFGQSTFGLADEDGTRLLVDPWIRENPHCEASVGAFDEVTAILVTHGAYDHLGDAPEIAKRSGAELVCDYATHTVLSGDGFPEDQLTGLIYGQRLEREDWSATAVYARHISMFSEEGVIGPPLAYVITVGGERVYHMGDTSLFGDIELYGDRYEPTVCLVPVGEAEGSLPDMYPGEAATAVGWVNPDVAVPMHYPPGSDKPDAFIRHCQDQNVDDGTTVDAVTPGTTIYM